MTTYLDHSSTNDNVLFVKVKGVVGNLYVPAGKSDVVLLYAKGGPTFGDNGNLSIYWKAAKKLGVSVFVPDYLGSNRSDGTMFSLNSALETLKVSEKFLECKIQAKNILDGSHIKVRFKTIVLVGGSWGGSMVPFYPQYNTKTHIQHIALLAPVTDWKKQGASGHKEETVQEVWRSIDYAWKNIFRNIEKSNWKNIMEGKDKGGNPIDNIDTMKNKNVYIIHGDADECVHWSQSKAYLDSLKTINKRVFWRLLKGVTHFDPIKIKGTKVLLKQLQKEGVL